VHLSGLILAAGNSKRMGSGNKLLKKIDDLPMINHTINAAIKSNLNDLFIITGYESFKVKNTLNSFKVNIIRNMNWKEGIGSSISIGVRTIKNLSDGLMIILGDMPFTESSIINDLIKNFRKDKIIIPTKKGKKGHPILFPLNFFKDLEGLKGDRGARQFIDNNESKIFSMEVSSNSIFYDIDTKEDLVKIQYKNLK
jgi:molybdenum cofactor cytidylyltransferase